MAKHDISAALHCRSDGEKINSTSIREVMKTVVDSLPRGKILKTDYSCKTGLLTYVVYGKTCAILTIFLSHVAVMGVHNQCRADKNVIPNFVNTPHNTKYG